MPQLIAAPRLPPKIRREVLQAMMQNNVERGGIPLNDRPFAFSFRRHFRTIAVVEGQICWDWCYIDTLWVDEKHRNQGLGTALMQTVENEARSKNVVGIYLWTQSWEAPHFYEKHGYMRFTTFENCPRTHQRYGYRKYL